MTTQNAFKYFKTSPKSSA